MLLSSDVEINLSPKRTLKANLSICHWNLNSISAHNQAKLSLLRVYLTFHKFGNICLSETYFNSSNSPDDETLEISGYSLVRFDCQQGFAFSVKITYPCELSASVIYQNVKISNNDWK